MECTQSPALFISGIIFAGVLFAIAVKWFRSHYDYSKKPVSTGSGGGGSRTEREVEEK